MNNAHNALDLIGRILIAYFFIPAGIEKIGGYTGTAAAMVSQGIPGWLLPLVILTEIGCGLAVLLGWHTRIGAFLLGGFTFLAVIFFHLSLAAGLHQTTITVAETAVGGGLWILASHGAGAWSLDALLGRGHREPASALS
ncbi:MAG TPA: DoxX family protein [Nevskiaceae bacterium]|nr:DoxX family protein [Nevskiaceae bacterium]